MDFILEVVSGADVGRQVYLDGEVVIGRDGQYANVVVQDGRVARAHCRVFPRGGAWYVVDLGGAGTFLNSAHLGSAC